MAAIQAVKKTSDVIPLAHAGVPVEGCVVRVEPVEGSLDDDFKDEWSYLSRSREERIEEAISLSRPVGKHGGVRISVQVETTAKTGVEMEALTGVMGGALTVVDMCKGVDKGCVIGGVRVALKTGGRSGGSGAWGQRAGEKERLLALASWMSDENLTGTETDYFKGRFRSMDETPEQTAKMPGKEKADEQADDKRGETAKPYKRWTPGRGVE